MREFKDPSGRSWIADVYALDGYDYKGRYYLILRPADGEGGEVALTEIRWNSERTAQRTLDTMSVVELHRRLRNAVSRAVSA